jgi:hypothetical protein
MTTIRVPYFCTGKRYTVKRQTAQYNEHVKAFAEASIRWRHHKPPCASHAPNGSARTAPQNSCGAEPVRAVQAVLPAASVPSAAAAAPTAAGDVGGVTAVRDHSSCASARGCEPSVTVHSSGPSVATSTGAPAGNGRRRLVTHAFPACYSTQTATTIPSTPRLSPNITSPEPASMPTRKAQGSQHTTHSGPHP